MRHSLLAAAALLLHSAGAQADFAHETDVSLRLDADSARDDRFQYRIRFAPSYRLTDLWSVHAFVATGDEFTSANSTIDANDDEIHVRHLFGRYETRAGKVEFGVIPPYKGRVSSTGLSNEGWIKGVRGVVAVPNGRLELVAGELNDLRSSRALSLPSEIDYWEMEYSADLKGAWSYEVAAERLLGDTFLRGEIRFDAKTAGVLAIETIRNADSRDHQWVVSFERELPAVGRDVELFSFYAYAPIGFGQRAELTEDFLDFGHAFSTQLSGSIGGNDKHSWFVTLEFYEGRTRALLGLQFDW